jgi:hypothetical protein
MEPEVGIEPTTYRLQDGRYPYTQASTRNCSAGPEITNPTGHRELTQFRVTNRVMHHQTITRVSHSGSNLDLPLRCVPVVTLAIRARPRPSGSVLTGFRPGRVLAHPARRGAQCGYLPWCGT